MLNSLIKTHELSMSSCFLSLFPPLVFSIFASEYAYATCIDHFAGQVAPSSVHSTVMLCSTSFAVGYSGQAKEPLWSAEHLIEEDITKAQSLQGRALFHEDLRIPPAARSELYDYKHSGWSRGHLAPSGDAPTRETRAETFALSNIVPQDAGLNSGPWNRIESNIRHITEREGELYVVTGPAFVDDMGAIGADQVAVPSALWRAVYVPTLHAVAVVMCENEVPYHCRAVSVDELRLVSGVVPFPALRTKRNRELEKGMLS